MEHLSNEVEENEEWPLDEDGIPHRQAARAVLRDPEGRVLLILGHDIDDVEHKWWFTVGGGLNGEEPREGLAREVYEETGLKIHPERFIGPVLDRSSSFHFARMTRRQDELFFLVDLSAEELKEIRAGHSLTHLEKQVLDEFRWWDIEHIRLAQAEGVTFYPVGLDTFLERWWPQWDGVTLHTHEE